MIFRNPGPGAFGTLTVEEASAPITVTYNNGSEYTVPFNSKRITYEMLGTINSPKLVYEHGVIITDWGTVNLTTDEQKLIVNDNIYIPILNGSSLSKSAIGAESLAIKPYEYLDTLGNISNVNVTLDTDYPELWNDTLLSSSVLADLSFSGTVEFGSDKIYINTSVPYLKLPDQTASGPLHAGMISCTVEDPDGGGDGDVLWTAGEGTDIMATGSRVANVPSSENATAIAVQDFVVDLSVDDKLNNDFLAITVTDYNGNWWKAEMLFLKPDKIKAIYLKSGEGTSENLTDFSFIDYPTVDLFNSLNFETKTGVGGMYQNASVGSDNRLVTLVGDSQNMIDNALISFRLMWAG
jgi:hypothetical protein